TRAWSGGTGTSARAAGSSSARASSAVQQSRKAAFMIGTLLALRLAVGALPGRAEIDGRRCRQRPFVLDREARLGVVAEQHGGEVGGETAHREVVVLHGLDIAVARHR